jgi:hypothetical protein
VTRRYGSNLILRVRTKSGDVVELPFKGVSHVLPDFEALIAFVRMNGPLKLRLPEDVGPANILEAELLLKEK